jgi:Mn-dependent DtxR family transcriptional regulator
MNEDHIREITEDLLRIIAEKKQDAVSLSMLKEDISADSELFTAAIGELKEEGLIRIENHEVTITKTGREKAEKILARHEIIEKYFHEILKEPMSHNMAHALEHFIADKTVRRMREFLNMREKGKPAPDFPLEREFLIIAVDITDKRILEKIIGLGLTPGSRGKIEGKIPNALIFNIGGRKVALANEIAKKIVAVVEDESH